MGYIKQISEKGNNFILWYSKQVVRRPWLGMSLGIAAGVFMTIIGFISFPFALDPSGAQFTPRSSQVGDYHDAIAVSLEVSRFNPIRSEGTVEVVTEQQTSRRYDMTVYYWMREENGNVFTDERVDFQRRVEQGLQELDGYTDVCYREPGTGECAPPSSLTKYFYAEKNGACNTYNPNGKAATRYTTINTALLNLINPSALEVYCVQAGAVCNASCVAPQVDNADFAADKWFGYPNGDTGASPNLQSNVTKTTFYFGLPLSGYKNAEDRNAEQIKIVTDFITDKANKYLDPFQDEKQPTLRYTSEIQVEEYIQALIVQDAAVVVVSIVAVMLYIWFHTGSLFVAGFGMLHIILSFPITYLWTQILIDFGLMGILNFLSLFIILGVGADDIFIFVDAWRQSQHEVPVREASSNDMEMKDLSQEEQDAYMDKATTNGTEENKEWLQRRLAWTYRRAAIAMLITSTTTGAAFLMTLTSAVPAIQIFGLFTAFMVFINYLFVITYFPCVVVIWNNRFFGVKCCGSLTSEATKDRRASVQATQQFGAYQMDDTARESVEDYRRLERFFHDTFAPFMNKNRYYFVLGFAIFLGVSVGYAAQLSPADGPTEFLPSGDPVMQTIRIESELFKQPENFPQLRIASGILGIKRDNPFNPEKLGTPIFDSNFDVSAKASQQTYITFCEEMRKQEYVRSEQVLCPMEAFRDYAVDVRGKTFPVEQAEFFDLLADFTAAYEAANGPAPEYGDEPDDRSERLNELSSLYDTIRWSTTEEKKLLYLTALVNTTLNYRLAAADIEPAYDVWKDFLDTYTATQPMVDATLSTTIQGAELWVRMELENTLFTSALSGILASLAIALAVIYLSTRSIILTFSAILSICGTVASLIAFMVWFGWSMDIIVSICITILVGLSVDYVVHIANAYRESKKTTRALRIQDSLTLLGISVFSAGITSMLSSFILLATVVIFFFKFGAFIAMTIFLSLIYTFLFFVPLVSIIGPETQKTDVEIVKDWFAGRNSGPARNHPTDV